MKTGNRRYKAPDLPLHVTYQNVKDAVANDQRNCTFGQCELSRTHGMDFYVDMDPENPNIWAEWFSREDGQRVHHRADVRRRHPDGTETMHEALTVVAMTDVAKKPFLKKFPKQGMDWVLTNHTCRIGRSQEDGRPKATERELKAKRERQEELKRLRAAGLADPPKTRKHRVRARFGSAPAGVGR